MNKHREWLAALALALALPAFAQEEPEEDPYAEEEPAADDSYAAEDPYAVETAPAEEPPADAIETTPTEDEALDTVAVNEAEEEPVEEADPLWLFAGADYVATTLSASTLSGFDTREYDSAMYRMRFGMRLNYDVSVALHVGFDASGDGDDEAATESYYGLFVSPTANLFDWAELTFPVGYAQTSVERPGASEDLNSLAYGVNLELPLRNFDGDWPDLRFGAGWMVYYQKSDARLYGWNAGVRYDFNFNNPFAGWELDLWPFGGDDDDDA